jgi:3-deoxy-manno-octulosonate cytidylyltransferase (CMP-KDO synthetase)
MAKKNVVAIIPARMGASRFPGKPLKKILDLPLVEHVRRRVLLSDSIDEVVVATCDVEIEKAIIEYGGRAIMTADTHERCTDRVEEAIKQIDADLVVIVQGDEPLFLPQVIERLVKPMLDNDDIQCTNLLSLINNDADLLDEDIVKAVLNNQNDVMYFSRSPIPFRRVQNRCMLYRQTGVSAFSKSFLRQYSNLEETPLEIAESVDFLRIIEHGLSIRGIIVSDETKGVDRPADVPIVEDMLKNNSEQNRLYQKIMEI